jgi:hypothetical protein
MANLTPHPLIGGIGAGLELSKQGKKLIDDGVGEVVTTGAAVTPRGELPDAINAAEQRNIVGVAAASNVELVTFAGYVGPLLKHDNRTWCLLYLDTRLQSWLLVDRDGIVFRDPIKDDQAPCGVQDVLWVKADALVKSGSGSLSVEAQFLTGRFTQAGDFDSGSSGGTLAAATGVFCEARSVGCCRPKTPRG